MKNIVNKETNNKAAALDRVPEKTEANPKANLHGMRPFEAAVAQITDELFFELRAHSMLENTMQLKTALRIYIDILEDLHHQIETSCPFELAPPKRQPNAHVFRMSS